MLVLTAVSIWLYLRLWLNRRLLATSIDSRAFEKAINCNMLNALVTAKSPNRAAVGAFLLNELGARPAPQSFTTRWRSTCVPTVAVSR